MFKTLLVTGASALAFSLSAPAAAQDAAETPLPEMNFGEWGFDPGAIDTNVDPGDDFNAYANGKWVRENPIPPEFSRFGAFNILGEKSTSDVRALVTDLAAENPAPGTKEARIVDAFNAYMNVDAINAAGLAPAQPYLAKIYGAQDLGALVDLFGEPGVPSLISAGVGVDEKDPTSYAVSVGFNGMGLPDRDYYLVDNERNAEIRAKYKDYLAFLLGKAGYSDAAAAAESVYGFERQVAELEWDRTVLRNADLTYTKITRDELIALSPEFPTLRFLQAEEFADVDTFILPQLPPSAERAEELGLDAATMAKIGGGTPAMMKLLTETPLATLKAFMAAQMLSDAASVLPSDIDDARFAFFGKFLGGQEEQRPRWKRAIGSTEGLLGEQLGAAYVERYFPPESKAAMDDLVANLRKSLAASIAEIDWMTEPTKAQALAKLNSFTPKIGYPDEFETYDGLTIAGDDAFGNRLRSIAWQVADNKSKLGQPVDRTEWYMLPQTVNAYYNPPMNEIVFPAGILQQPFFGASADAAVNYGGIGAVIGHEMGHGFDDQGSKYDATGTLRNWWQDADRAQFDELGDKLVAQYDSYCPYDDGKTCVNGRFTLGENIGDVGGLSMAYRAYRMSLNGEEAPVIDGLTGDQRFFLAWAQVWRSMQREEAGRQRLLTDPHSPETFRVNGPVRNMDAWYKAFNVTPDDELYIAPEDRVVIW